MKPKIIFIDIDGTLVTSREEIPISAQVAIKKAKENGHLLYLCTGRSKPEIYDYIMEVGFDGVIGAGGGYIDANKEMIYHKQVEAESVKHMVDYFTANDFSFYLESNGGLYGNTPLEASLNKALLSTLPEGTSLDDYSHPFSEKILYSNDNLYRDDINKACFIENPNVSFETIKAEFLGEFEVIHCTVPAFGDDSGELMVPGVNKGVAIQFLLEHLGLSIADTIAIGDGMNDLEMLELCQVGIAMGNAKDGLKSIADFVTTDLEDDGLYNAFKTYNLV